MLLRNTAEHFGVIAKVFHWSIALLMIGLIWLGWYMVDLNYYHPWHNDALSGHKSLGMIALTLALAKLFWGLYSPAPSLTQSRRAWEGAVTRASHAILTAAMLVLPVSGYVISTSAGDAVAVFDWFTVPAVFVANERVLDVAIDIHYYIAYATAILVVLHAGAAIKHQIIDGDGTLRRMF